ncbi:MAG: hypothetical protein AAF570_26575, partial [Bacteroidota bacterium]
KNYVADKDAYAAVNSKPEPYDWFDYYNEEPAKGIHVDKLISPDTAPDLLADYDNPFTVGAGISLATAADGGRTFSSKLFLLLSIPNLILLEGKVNILGERVGLDGADPPYFAFIVLTSESVYAGIGANYKKPPEDGKLIDLYAEVELAYFFGNPSAWFVNFGTEAEPITARIAQMFDAYAFLMLSSSGIRAGAGADYEFNKSYLGGKLRADVDVYFKMGGEVSFERPQFSAYWMLGGTVDARVFFYNFYFSLDTSLSAQIPKPFIIEGAVDLCIRVPWLFKKKEKCFTVRFQWIKDPEIDIAPIEPSDQTDPDNKPPAAAINIHSGETFPVAIFGSTPPANDSDSKFNQAIIPLDSWVDLEFSKSLEPGAVSSLVGGVNNPAQDNFDLIPPAPVDMQVQHTYK